jgi:hypothetical protein
MLADASPWLTGRGHISAYMPKLAHFPFPSLICTNREKFLFVQNPQFPIYSHRLGPNIVYKIFFLNNASEFIPLHAISLSKRIHFALRAVIFLPQFRYILCSYFLSMYIMEVYVPFLSILVAFQKGWCGLN